VVVRGIDGRSRTLRVDESDVLNVYVPRRLRWSIKHQPDRAPEPKLVDSLALEELEVLIRHARETRPRSGDIPAHSRSRAITHVSPTRRLGVIRKNAVPRFRAVMPGYGGNADQKC
jgi:hypothetical protein